MKLSTKLLIVFIILVIKLNAQPINIPWIEKMNMYEVNVRQYSTEGTFKEFKKYLPRLKNMGVKVLWFMPINPIGLKDRKGSLGSYYSISNYKEINPEFGRMSDWIDLVSEAHKLGFKVIIDWVPAHTSADHDWIFTHKKFYVLDKKGNPTYQYDWKDTRKLNYNNKELYDSMISAMSFWVKNSDIDGFRVDVASEIPDEFWLKAIPRLQKIKPLFFLAEADKPNLHKVGFHATYSWREFQFMKKIVEFSAHKKKRKKYNAANFYKLLTQINKEFPPYYQRLYFTSNHDENSWNKADYSTMPNKTHAPFAILTQTLPNGFPLIYSGQEIPMKRALKFFDKDEIFSNPDIEYDKLGRFYFYQTLLSLREDKTFNNNAQFYKLKSKNKHILAFIKSFNDFNLLVIVNLSDEFQKPGLKFDFGDYKLYDIFAEKQVTIPTDFELKSWDFKVFKF